MTYRVQVDPKQIQALNDGEEIVVLVRMEPQPVIKDVHGAPKGTPSVPVCAGCGLLPVLFRTHVGGKTWISCVTNGCNSAPHTIESWIRKHFFVNPVAVGDTVELLEPWTTYNVSRYGADPGAGYEVSDGEYAYQADWEDLDELRSDVRSDYEECGALDVTVIVYEDRWHPAEEMPDGAIRHRPTVHSIAHREQDGHYWEVRLSQ